MPTDTQVNDLKINVLTEAQYEQIQSPSATELYLVPETVDTTPTSGSTNPITSGGVYAALQNIPEQEQSDWNETDNTDPAYIKNKPTIPDVLEDLTDVVYDYEGKYIPNALTDYDGNSYGAVILGDQVWMAENLRTTHYADGTAVTYTDCPSNKFTLKERGLFYLWQDLMKNASTSVSNPSGIQGVAPNGWHIPSQAEFTQLNNYLSQNAKYHVGGDSTYIGKALASNYGWNLSETEYSIGYNQNENNISGLNIIPVGVGTSTNTSEGEGDRAVIANTYGLPSSSPYPYVLAKDYKTGGTMTTQYAYTVWKFSVRCVYDGTPEQFIRMLMDKQVLVYDSSKQAWVNKNVAETLPSMSGNSGKVLAVNGTETDVEWVSTQECMWYGVRKDRSNDSTTLERIGNLEMHKTLPIQSKMRRCLLLDNGTVNYYLSDTDSTKKEDGVTAAVLDGTDGQVMVEIPEHYVMYDTYTDEVTGHVINEWKISECPLPGFTKVNKCYYSAYEAALDRTNNKLSSVVNTTAQYRGGNNTSSWDGTYRSLLGMPVTNTTTNAFRALAKNRGDRWSLQYNALYTTVCTLYLVEYANTNIQLDYNSSLTPDGYHQGGLGNGVTTVPAGNNSWPNYNNYNPMCPCGITNSLGNNSGTVSYTIESATQGEPFANVNVPSYRGIENLYGHIWKFMDGVIVQVQSNDAGGESKVYICDDISKFTDVPTSDYEYIGNTLRASQAGVKNIMFPCMIPQESGATSTTGWADAFSGGAVTAVQNRVPRVGGMSIQSSGAGIACIDIDYWFTYGHAIAGSRLCYTPMTVELPPLEGNSGKVLAVNSGENGVEWVRPVTVYSGSSEPSASLGEDGDIFILAS